MPTSPAALNFQSLATLKTETVLNPYEHIPEDTTSLYQLAERVIYGSSRLGLNTNKVDMLDENPGEIISLSLGNKLYEMSNHLGNVLTVINDIKVPYLDGSDVAYYATIVSTADYSPFGVQLDERTESAESYRYGFQGQEKDDELKGAGNSVNYTYRMHDPRLGRFFAVDPMHHIYSYNSPYGFSENRVLDAIELEGLETFRIIDLHNGFYRLTYIKQSDVLVVYDEFNNTVDQSMGTNFKYKDLQYQMRDFSFVCVGDKCELDTPHRGENYKTPGPAPVTSNDLASNKTHFTDMSSFSILFNDKCLSETLPVRT